MSIDAILNTTTAAASYDLVELDIVKEEFDIGVVDYDGMLLRWIAEESQRVADFCNRVFPVETIREEIYIHGNSSAGEPWPNAIVLGRRPVVAITSIVEDDVTLTTLEYKLDAASGELFRLCDTYRRWWIARQVVITYTAGYATIPAVISQGCLTLLKHRWSARKRDPALRSITVNDVQSKTFWVGSRGDVGDIPPEVAGNLERYVEISNG